MDDLSLLSALGGTYAVAALAGVKPPSVSGWKQVARIPMDKKILLAVIAEKRGIATRQELFPDTCQRIWPELITPEHPAPDTAEVDHA